MVFPIYQTKNAFHSNSKDALDLASKSYLGEIKDGKVHYSLYEALLLLDTKKADILDSKNKKQKHNDLIKKANPLLYLVFRDLRNKGHILKEGLKFGSDFRVYNKGDKPGKAHAKYLLEALSSNKKLNLKDF
ncbi:MAG: tRNA-intron lyase, partial [archaeon]|nr:tRNA-intron lyase [archaeon]